MSSLQGRLDRIKAAFAEQAPEDIQAVMARATKDLRDSGIMSGVPKPGDALPQFELPDTEGNRVRSVDLLEQGPLVITVYRGVW